MLCGACVPKEVDIIEAEAATGIHCQDSLSCPDLGDHLGTCALVLRRQVVGIVERTPHAESPYPYPDNPYPLN